MIVWTFIGGGVVVLAGLVWLVYGGEDVDDREEY